MEAGCAGDEGASRRWRSCGRRYGRQLREAELAGTSTMRRRTGGR